MTSNGESKLTDDIKALIGVEGEEHEVTVWGVEREGLRRFTQAVMDPDPRHFDEKFAKSTVGYSESGYKQYFKKGFAKSTKFGETTTPGIYVTYLNRTHPREDDPVTRAFKENPVSDGIGGVRTSSRPGALPDVPTDLVRVLNAGNEIEVYKYPSMGDRVFAKNKYHNITERVGRDGSHMLIITMETTYRNQDGTLLCITRSSSFRR